MVVVSFFSGSKGGVGKSTLSALVSLITSLKYRTLVLDISGRGASALLLPHKLDSAQCIDDIFRGIYTKLKIYNISRDVKIRTGGLFRRAVDVMKVSVDVIPSREPIPPDPHALSLLVNVVKYELARRYDVVILDMPTLPLSSFSKVEANFMNLLLASDRVFIVAEYGKHDVFDQFTDIPVLTFRVLNKVISQQDIKTVKADVLVPFIAPLCQSIEFFIDVALRSIDVFPQLRDAVIKLVKLIFYPS
ncbi:MAG: hypothetical protein DRJ40_10905 [Thermoprotei archaeon]|nr:MAG: hypothetical protein DRJ40_10905 [Thermoprotei archaeon]